MSYRSQLGASADWATGRAKASFSCEGSSFDGVPGFALTRLQNLASGVGSKKRASVAAEVSGRGLVRGG